MTINEYNMELQKMVSFKSVGFGFLSITVVLIISFLHYLEIKRVLHNRKIIWINDTVYVNIYFTTFKRYYVKGNEANLWYK